MSREITIVLPYPPSVNHYWQHTRAGRAFVGKQGREYKARVAEICREFKPFLSAVKIEMLVVFPDRRKRDLDNLPKAIFDGLTSGGLLADDNNRVITEYLIKSSGIEKPGKIILKIKGV